MILKIACVQSDIIAQKPAENLKHIDNLIDKIKNDRDIIILPETFTTGFPAEPEIFAEKENGETMRWMQKKAHEKNCVICGSFITSYNNNYYNSFIWMNPDNSYHIYNKRHIFAMGGEKGLTNGKELITISLKGWKIRLFTCYDLRFPVWLRNTYKNNEFEYDLAILTANWPSQKSFIWNTLLAARAIENQAYFIGVNRVGKDHNDISYVGETKVVNGKGKTIAEISGDKEGIVETDIDKESLTDFRNYFTIGQDWDNFDII